MTATTSVLVRGLSRRQLIAADAVLAVVVATIGWYAATEVPPVGLDGWREPPWMSVLVGLALGASVAVRRCRPVAAAWASLALAVFALASGVVPYFASMAPALALGLVLYTAGAQVAGRMSVWIVVVAVVLVAATGWWASRDVFGTGLLAWVVGACWTVGRGLRERREYAAHSAEQATALAIDRERLSIARDLHDLMGNTMSMIAVRASVGDRIADSRPEEMREALRVITLASRSSLAEVRRTVAALRSEAVTMPAPGLADLGRLAEAARSAGLAVDIEVRGDPVVPESVGLAVFRMTQESVTNVLKHARATTCRIEVGVDPGEIRLRVTNDGPGPDAKAEPVARPEGEAGQGLIGMRERAAMFGGQLHAGPEPGGGWVVDTRLRYAV